MSKSESDIKVLKTATCKSTSGKSTLTYQIGVLPDSTVHIRISRNSAAGFVNRDWIAVTDIQKTLANVPEEKPLTSFQLQPLFRGKSSNSPGFLMAVLSTLGLTRALKGKTRGHELQDPEGFNAKMQRLLSAKAKPKRGTSSTRKKTVTRKAAVKKKTMARKKAARAH